MRQINILFLIFCICLARGDNSRNTRSLLYGPFGVIQFILGYGTPVPDQLTPSISIGYFLRGVYSLPKNSSDYTHPNITELSRQNRLTRWDIYRALEKDAEMRGHGGRHCILRAICQASAISIDKSHGLFEEIFHILFIPKTTKEFPREHSDNEYFAAYKFGINKDRSCEDLYPNCKCTLLDLISTLMNFENE